MGLLKEGDGLTVIDGNVKVSKQPEEFKMFTFGL